MNTITDFITNTYGSALFSFWLGYLWFVTMGVNGGNAIMMLGGVAFFAIATIAAVVAGAIWAAKHIRITII